MTHRIALFTLLLAFPAVLPAAESQGQGADALVLNNTGFLGAHPDLRWRREGAAALEDDRPREAFTFFRRAARYADKPSQAMVAEMLWTGTGVPADRALAYAWMDIAAERAYIPFVVKREQYWNALDEAGRARALEVGRPLYEEYRDAVAKERLEWQLTKAKRKVTGSRTGSIGFLAIVIPGPGGMRTVIDGNRFYDEQYWEPAKYWAWQDSIWKDPSTGSVNVNPLEVVRGEEEDGE